MMEWQPIETAPKNDAILLTDGAIRGIGAWDGAKWLFWEGDESDIEYTDVGPRVYLNYWVKGFGPTHWMPLPPAPEEKP